MTPIRNTNECLITATAIVLFYNTYGNFNTLYVCMAAKPDQCYRGCFDYIIDPMTHIFNTPCEFTTVIKQSHYFKYILQVPLVTLLWSTGIYTHNTYIINQLF